ncbi:hypothetical protein M5K25_020277 [Dendrobium thyrsiflorum]|uniref:Uncharacterized protein n=1 Tax=Dendrobium thyrsiflorum TaxID=117978 RepID=A0ABD0U9L9_DENTH
MADPEVGHGFIYDHQGLVDILQSPFFDLTLEVDNTVDEYVDRASTFRTLATHRTSSCIFLSGQLSVDQYPRRHFTFGGIFRFAETLHPLKPFIKKRLVDILQSSFFDPNPEVDDTVDDYIDRIIFTLAPSIEEHLPTGSWRIIGHPSTSPPPATSPTNNTCCPQPSKLPNCPLVFTHGSGANSTDFRFKRNQGELAYFRRQAGERLDSIERLGNPAIYTPSRPHSPYVDETQTEYGPPRDHYHHNQRPNQEPVGHDTPCIDNDAQLLKNVRIDAPSFDSTFS